MLSTRNNKSLQQQFRVVLIVLSMLLATLGGWILSSDPRMAGFLLLGVLTIVIFVSPFVGLLMFVGSLPFSTLIGETFFQGLPGFRYFGLIVAAGWLLMDILLRRKPMNLKLPQWWSSAGFVAFSLSSGLWAASLSAWEYRTQVLIQLLVLQLMIAHLINSQKKLQLLVYILVLSYVVDAVVAVLQSILNQQNRAVGLNWDPNILAAEILTVFPFAYFLFLAAIKCWARLGFGLSLMVMSAAIFASQSRGIFFAFAVLVPFLILGSHNFAGFRKIILFAMIIIVIAVYMVPLGLNIRLQETFEGADRHLSGRYDVWRIGYEMWSSRPLVGVGYGNFPTVYLSFLQEFPSPFLLLGVPKAAHNMFIGILAEVGLIGFGLFVVMLATTALTWHETVLTLQRVGLRNEYLLAMAIGYAILAYLLSSLSVMNEYQKIFWVLLGLQTGMYRLAQNARTGR